MKKALYPLAAGLLLLGASACDDFLDTSSPSTMDVDFVMSDPDNCRAALTGAYSTWEDRTNCLHSGGFAYDVNEGSDIERHAEVYTDHKDRNVPEAFYPADETIDIDYKNPATAWSKLYSLIGTCNTLINSIEQSSSYGEFLAGGVPTELSQIYGEAIALRATAYFYLTRYFGDVPYKVGPTDEDTHFESRYVIYQKEINNLIRVEPLMYRIGEKTGASTTQTANTISRTYVQGLIGRMCLDAGGYSTRRLDFDASFYVDADGKQLQFDDLGTSSEFKAAYGRITNYLDYYKIAETYLKACVENPGSVQLITLDERTEGGKTYANPYQRKYQYMNDLAISPEAIYEIAYQQAVAGSERPYNFGRGSDGGNNAYPCKTFGQMRFMPTYYYGMFNPADKRRDVTVTVTGSTGKGVEILTSLKGGSKGSAGGLMLNKWDENRMATPYTIKQRQSGIAAPIMAFDDVILMYAEVEAVLGNNGEAETQLLKIHNRAFDTPQTAAEVVAAQGGTLLEAIINERALEFGGEGYRRFDLIRTGLLGKYIKQTRAQMKALVEGLASDGYYEFDNGNQMPDSIWTKLVDAKHEVGWRLTTQCPAGQEDNGILYPGWRGQNDSWESYGMNYGSDSAKTNLAIKGLFKRIPRNSTEGAALAAEDYELVAWGATIADGNMKTEYTDNWMKGLSDELIDGNFVPRHLAPLASTVLQQNPLLSNGYGFPNE